MAAALAGAVATVLLSSPVHVAPVFDFPFVDAPHLFGGIVTGHPAAAF